MADISKIKLNGTTYTIKDATARANSGISQTDADSRYLKLSGGTLSGDLDLGTNSIKNFKDLTFTNTVAIEPVLITNEDDSTTRLYIKFSQGATSYSTPGDAHITGIADPIGSNDIANKIYVDSAISTANASYLPLAGGKMTGNIDMNNKEITKAAKIGFLRGAYFESSNLQQATVISAFIADGSAPAYLNAYAPTPYGDSSAMVLANKAYVDANNKIYIIELDGSDTAFTLNSNTPIEDINSAYNEGKVLFCKGTFNNHNFFVPLVSQTDDNYLFVVNFGSDLVVNNAVDLELTIVITSSGTVAAVVEEYWSYSKNNPVINITSSATDNDIPTAKAVYNYVNSVIGGIENGTY